MLRKRYTVYRLAQQPCTLPLHWAYSDPFRVVFDEHDAWVEDLRTPGAQVWGELDQVVRALAGEDMDGFYETDDYPYVLRLRTKNVRWAGASWHHVEPVDVIDVYQAEAQRFMAFVESLLGVESDPQGVRDRMDDFPEESLQQVFSAAFDEMAERCLPRWVETLRPKDYLSAADLRLPRREAW